MNTKTYANFVNSRLTAKNYRHKFCDVRRPYILQDAPKIYEEKPTTEKACVVYATVIVNV